MAKKNLSQAAGLDALFRRPTLPTEEKSKKASSTPTLKVKEKAPEKEAEKVVLPKSKRKERPVDKAVIEQPSNKASEKLVQELPPKKRKAEPKSSSKPPKARSANTFSVNLEGIRKTETKYTGIRLKKELFDKLSDIAKNEKVKSTNSLISKVLEAFCEGYEGNA